MCCSIPRWGLTLAGLAAATVALAAWHLGLDNNPVMGPRRLLLLVIGLGTVSLVHRSRIATLLRRGSPWSEPPVGTDSLRPDRESSEEHDTGFALGPSTPWAVVAPILAAVLCIQVWLFTAGKWTSLPGPTSYYYDMLAEAFASGQVSLKQVPDPRLAQLSNPYDPAQRAGIPRCRPGSIGPGCFPLDVSYFNDNYYLYWGPAPAALLALGKLIGLGKVGDNVIGLAGAIGLFLFLAIGLVNLWAHYFPRLPRWLLIPPLLLAGVAYPLPWALDTPLIYEAAILQGAAFLVAGLMLAIPVLTSDDNTPWRLALTGLLWGLSFGTRIVLALPIFALAAAMGLRMLRARLTASRQESLWKPLFALAFPMLAAAFLIGLYNFTRFSDPLESGWRYALGGDGVQFEGLHAVFRWGNIPANAYNYLLSPVSILEGFPFVQPLLARLSAGPIQIPHPGLFHAEYVTGLLISTPFLVFAFYLLWSLACGSVECADAPGGRARSGVLDQAGLRELVWPIFVASVAAFLPILFLYAVTARYLLDVSPFLTILAALGAWTAYSEYARTPVTRLLMGAAIVATSSASGVLSILLALNNLSR